MKNQRDKFVQAIGTRAKKKWPMGARYGKLVVTGHERQPNGCWAVLCECDCGRDKKVVRPDQMARGLIQSCGCLNSELAACDEKAKRPRVCWHREWHHLTSCYVITKNLHSLEVWPLN